VIAIDSSSWIAFFSDREPPGDDTALVESALADHQACLPPVVLTELLSDPQLPRGLAALLLGLLLVFLLPGPLVPAHRAGIGRDLFLVRRGDRPAGHKADGDRPAGYLPHGLLDRAAQAVLQPLHAPLAHDADGQRPLATLDHARALQPRMKGCAVHPPSQLSQRLCPHAFRRVAAHSYLSLDIVALPRLPISVQVC